MEQYKTTEIGIFAQVMNSKKNLMISFF
uniref:Uncharacterized protein n=1 Tax=Rhizophora mucronata TaxID=61149 RepID=A0A2P2QA22_RHIMU